MATLDPGARFADLQHIISRTRQGLCPVADQDGLHAGNPSPRYLVWGELCGPPEGPGPGQELGGLLMFFGEQD